MPRLCPAIVKCANCPAEFETLRPEQARYCPLCRYHINLEMQKQAQQRRRARLARRQKPCPRCGRRHQRLHTRKACRSA